MQQNAVKEDILLIKTKSFALDIIGFTESLPRSNASNVLGKQLLRSGTSVFANYRAVKKARSKADFIAKLGIVEEEADESACWLELLVDSRIVDKEKTRNLYSEAKQILAMTIASLKTAKKDRKKR